MEIWVLSVERAVHEIFATAELAKQHYEVIADTTVRWAEIGNNVWVTPDDNQVVIKSYVVVTEFS